MTAVLAPAAAARVLAARVPPSAIVINSSTPLWYLTRGARRARRIPGQGPGDSSQVMNVKVMKSEVPRIHIHRARAAGPHPARPCQTRLRNPDRNRSGLRATLGWGCRCRVTGPGSFRYGICFGNCFDNRAEAS
jgi:hypothetical protein